MKAPIRYQGHVAIMADHSASFSPGCADATVQLDFDGNGLI